LERFLPNELAASDKDAAFFSWQVVSMTEAMSQPPDVEDDDEEEALPPHAAAALLEEMARREAGKE
jgi:hypothetical protein